LYEIKETSLHVQLQSTTPRYILMLGKLGQLRVSSGSLGFIKVH